MLDVAADLDLNKERTAEFVFEEVFSLHRLALGFEENPHIDVCGGLRKRDHGGPENGASQTERAKGVL